MNRESYEQLIVEAKIEALETIGNNTSPQRIEYAMDMLAERVAAITREYHLTNLMGLDDAAKHLGIETSVVRQMLIGRNQQEPIGKMIGNDTWVIDIDDLHSLAQER
jgi:hypothetical protein